ncbi:DM13 domain-containing protein [uncultured Arthrobacter sp.]|uniref:DM13 domain-containing protein n=1 Tax=uncultured Arthrobacter sp. TaxID=114050 RepID=UPI0025EF067D|nr:DM13 domain-containing protein [uncultured Arthrobacter sp.]
MTRRRVTLLVVLVGVLALAAAGLVFKPWLLFVDTRVNDTIPQVAQPLGSGEALPGPASAAPERPGTPDATRSPEQAKTAEAQPRQLSAGTFVSHEHRTTGAVSVIEQPDGSRLLAITGLDTTTGPDVHVWLSAADVVEGRDGWYTAGGAEFVDLGPIKGNQGDQLYNIPPDVDLSRYVAVDLWCVQFGVSFGAAQLLS